MFGAFWPHERAKTRLYALRAAISGWMPRMFSTRVSCRHRQVIGEGRVYPGLRSGSGGTRNTCHLGPDLKGPSTSPAMINGVGVCRTAEEIGNLIVSRQEALSLSG